MPAFEGPYEFFRGCKTIRKGYCIEDGKKCESENLCTTDCTREECSQVAKEKGAEGFSFLRDYGTKCNLCTLDQNNTLQMEDSSSVGSKVYYTGKRCVSENECTNCSYGLCLQLANKKDSEGFSYSTKPDGASSCNLCTIEQLDTLQTMFVFDDDEFSNHWAVYRRSGNVTVDVTMAG